MKTARRLALGIFLGALCGAALVAGIIFILPDSFNFHSVNLAPFVNFLQFAFGRWADHPAVFLSCSGAIVGAVTGLFVAKAIPNRKMWLAVLLAFVSGVALTGWLMFSRAEKFGDRINTTWEHTYESDRAAMTLISLKAIDRGITNQLYLTNFQNRGRDILSNYVRQVESWPTNSFELPAKDYPFYRRAKEYLAAHPQEDLGN